MNAVDLEMYYDERKLNALRNHYDGTIEGYIEYQLDILFEEIVPYNEQKAIEELNHQEEAQADKDAKKMNDEGIDFSKAKLLEEGWQWKMYDDGSGHLENADGKSYFSYDIQTQEYVGLNNKWRFMSEYPDHTPYEKFKTEMEIDIVRSGLAEPSEQFKKVVDLQNNLFASDKCNSLFSYSSYTNMYNRTDEMYQVLLDYEKALEDENSLDLDLVNKLSEFYSKYAICDLLSDSHKEILVDAVEMEQDWSNEVSSEVYSVYDLICMEQGESEGQGMQM